jgi:hypothetical protein
VHAVLMAPAGQRGQRGYALAYIPFRYFVSVTALVFQDEMSPLKAVALLNTAPPQPPSSHQVGVMGPSPTPARVPHRKQGAKGGVHAALLLAPVGQGEGGRAGRESTHAWEVWGASPRPRAVQATASTEGARTVVHGHHGARVPRRDVAVESRGALEHCATATPPPTRQVSLVRAPRQRANPGEVGGMHQGGVHAVLLAPAWQRGERGVGKARMHGKCGARAPRPRAAEAAASVEWVRTTLHIYHGARVPRRKVTVEGRGVLEHCAAAAPPRHALGVTGPSPTPARVPRGRCGTCTKGACTWR